MKKAELLRDIAILIGIWSALLAVIFQEIPESVVPLATKIQLAILATIAILFAFPVYFRWDWIRRRSTLMVRTIIGALAIILSVYMGFVLDYTAIITWQWVVLSGFLVVTWLNVIGLAFLIFSLLLYNWAARNFLVLAVEWKGALKTKKAKRPLKSRSP